jgi:sterol desaturase/sphingolipid hydroxylase (fatty acid hydroxylase superfamily)
LTPVKKLRFGPARVKAGHGVLEPFSARVRLRKVFAAFRLMSSFHCGHFARGVCYSTAHSLMAWLRCGERQARALERIGGWNFGMTYNWMALLWFIALLIGVTMLGRALLFRDPDLVALREKNKELSKARAANYKEAWVIEAGKRVGIGLNLAFLFGVLPFIATLQPLPIWRYAVDAVAVLMIFDFYYYLTHRFAFHGVGWLRRVHGVHHQSLNPVHIDGFYVHPVETAIGISLFFAGIVTWWLVIGPMHVVTLVVCTLVFTWVNTWNHLFFDLNKFPYKTLHYAIAKHHVHHKNMRMGNYATLTMVYDRIFGTLD